MYALIGREMGLLEVIVRNAPNWLDTLGELVIGEGGLAGSRDNEYTFESYEAGFDLFDGISLADVMSNRGIEMQIPDRWEAWEWPSDETSNETLTRKAAQGLNNLLGPEITDNL